jgi:hypothetical protein
MTKVMVQQLTIQPIVTRTANFTARELLTMIPKHRWPCLNGTFPCPNPYCHSNGEITEAHLQEHSELYENGLFSDPLIATLAGLIGSRLDMAEGTNFACPFLGNGCNCRAKSFTKLKAHMKKHPKDIKIYHTNFVVFWVPIVRHYVLYNR